VGRGGELVSELRGCHLLVVPSAWKRLRILAPLRREAGAVRVAGGPLLPRVASYRVGDFRVAT
jgi:hypothetical protein